MHYSSNDGPFLSQGTNNKHKSQVTEGKEKQISIGVYYMHTTPEKSDLMKRRENNHYK